MSYRSENYTSSSSYRNIFGDSPRHVSSLSRPTMSSYRGEWSWHNNSSRGLSSKRSSHYMPLEPSFDLAQSTALDDFKTIRTNEKVQLQGLNDRFAMFIEKVHNLEQQNNVMVTIDQQQTGPSRLVELHEQKFRELRSELDQLNREKSQHIIDKDRMQDKLQEYEEKYREECRAREYAEFTLAEFRKDVDDATMVRLDLQKKVESLLDEINFLKKEREEEVAELMVRIENIKVSVQTMEVSKLDLTSALKEIRVQYESIASNNLQSAVEWYENKIAELSEQASQSTDAIHNSKEEMNGFRTQLQSKTIEIDSLRGTNKSLEKQLHEMEQRHHVEMRNHQDNMAELEKEMRASKSSMTRHVREYQDLLNVKLALDIEITAYRKLLEGEEKRIDKGINNSGIQGYYRSHSYTSSSRGSMKEGRNEDPQQSMSGGKHEVTMVTTTTTTTTDNPSDIATNQNN